MIYVIPEESGQALATKPRVGTTLVIEGQEFTILDGFCEVSDALRYLVAVNTKGDLEILRSVMLNREQGRWYQCKATEKEVEKFA